VWETARHVLETAAHLDEESLALGGLETVGVNLDVATEIEIAHAAVEDAERLMATRRKQGLLATGGAGLVGVATLPIVPLVAPVALIGAAGAALWSFVGPRKKLQEAEADEQTVLQNAGVPTYLSFHMRRIDATSDPNAGERPLRRRRPHPGGRDGAQAGGARRHGPPAAPAGEGRSRRGRGPRRARVHPGPDRRRRPGRRQPRGGPRGGHHWGPPP